MKAELQDASSSSATPSQSLSIPSLQVGPVGEVGVQVPVELSGEPGIAWLGAQRAVAAHQRQRAGAGEHQRGQAQSSQPAAHQKASPMAR